MDGNTAGRTVKSVEKMIEIIEIIDDLDGASHAELVERTDLARSSIHGYVSTLKSAGYLVKEGPEYHLSLRFHHLGSVARNRKPVFQLADKITKALSNRTELSADFIVEQAGELISISSFKAGRQGTSGVYFDYHNSASGKAILMERSDSEILNIVDFESANEDRDADSTDSPDLLFDSRPRTTTNTINSESEFLAEIERSRERGYAVNDQEIHEGLRAIATPIVAPSGTTVGALSVAGASYRITDDVVKTELSTVLFDVRDEFEEQIASSIEYQY